MNMIMTMMNKRRKSVCQDIINIQAKHCLYLFQNTHFSHLTCM